MSDQKAPIQRREFLKLASYLAGLGAVGITGTHLFEELIYSADPVFHVSGVPSSSSEIEKIGNAYLDQYPDERSLAFILQSLGLSEQKLNQASPGELRDMIYNLIRQDVEDDKLVQVNGWFLTLTEARFYALSTFI